jgi:cobalt-zinc-cadmium efflux system protein
MAGDKHGSPQGHSGHPHGAGPNSDVRYLALALVLICVFMVFEVVFAVVAGSLALLADAGHMLTDAGAIAASIWAARLSARPPTGVMTWGFKRAEVLSAALNGVTLLIVGALVLFDAIRRLAHPVTVDGAVLLVVAGVGVAVNLAATASLARANRTRMSVAGAWAHLVTDLWAFLGTFVAGIVIVASGFERADPIASLAVVALMAFAAAKLLRASGRVLLEATPEGVDLDEVRAHLLDLPDVRAVHDLHAWLVTSDLPAVSAHVVVADDCFASGAAARLLDELQGCLAGHFDVEHSTFQLEALGHTDHEPARHD